MRIDILLVALLLGIVCPACGPNGGLAPVETDVTVPEEKDFKFEGAGYADFAVAGEKPDRLRTRSGLTRFRFSAPHFSLRVVLDIDRGGTGTFKSAQTPQLTYGREKEDGTCCITENYKAETPIKVTLQKNSSKHCKGALKGRFDFWAGNGDEEKLSEPITVEGRFDYRSEDHRRRSR
ncbi:MAG: hypothetical protein ABEL76_15895 [Bradymonadaceae bacterium]